TETKPAVGFDGYNGDLTGDTAATLGVNCGMSTGRNGILRLAPSAYAANQRDELRDLHDVAGALCANQTMKQQTFVLNPWDTQQARVSVPEGVAPSLCGADGDVCERRQWRMKRAKRSGSGGSITTEGSEATIAATGGGGRNPAGLILAAGVVSKGDGDVFLTDEVHTSLTSGGGQAGQGYPCVMTAGFCAGAGSKAQGIGYQEEISPTLKSGGGNGMPSVICLNDQGGQRMDIYEGKTGTLRAQMDGHPPLVLTSQQDTHYTSLIEQPETFCIAGNAIDRQPHNGGNGLGYQADISYTLTSCDRHSVYSQQRSDEYIENSVASTQSARQYKDATDLVYQKTVGTLVASDKNGPNNQYVSDDKCIIMPTSLIRRLTPLECERLQGFPDGWTDIPNASDSARYKALGNSVAIPCVEHVLRGVSYFLNQGGDAGA
ncbi:DNA cytosine methyltransferase, partial [Oscillospiraceae bacterium OttesenSCG-928-G22]|nr:DNA cytosine methyltransferase [Oscillospiraceae bacterium OttesenSCG-928-G22]